MARRVFFSFHYERDIWRANVVRKSWVTQDRESAGFFDGSLQEAAKTKSPERLRALIRGRIKGTSCTVVLIGAQTAQRRFVRYELAESCGQGHAPLRVRIPAQPFGPWLRQTDQNALLVIYPEPHPWHALPIP